MLFRLVDSLKALDLIRPIREADIGGLAARTQWIAQLRGVFVSIGGGEDAEDGGAGDSTNVSHTFQPSGLLSLSNSP